jgi:hypothetical protein
MGVARVIGVHSGAAVAFKVHLPDVGMFLSGSGRRAIILRHEAGVGKTVVNINLFAPRARVTVDEDPAAEIVALASL